MNETNEREREMWLEFEENEIVPNYNWLWEMFGYSFLSLWLTLRALDHFILLWGVEKWLNKWLTEMKKYVSQTVWPEKNRQMSIIVAQK